MKNDSDILIPTDVILEWQNGIQDGLLTNQWWNSLTQKQQKQMLEFCSTFLISQKIKKTRLTSNSLINNLQNRSAGYLELTQNKNIFLLSGKIKRDSYGVIGQCHSQDADFVGDMCKGDLGNYFDETDDHKCGQQTVDIVCCAINSLPGLIASPTPFSSIADVGLRWDVILEWNNYYFPLQIKSSFQGIQEAMKKGSLGLYAREMLHLASIPIHKLQEMKSKQKNIDNYLREVERQTKKLHQSRDIETTITNYRKSTPIYIWANHDIQALHLLVNLFANTFKIDHNLEQYQEQAAGDYLDKYPPGTTKRKRKYDHNLQELEILLQAIDPNHYDNQIAQEELASEMYTSIKKREQIQEIIEKLQNQINIRDEQINNYKADKLPITLNKIRALQTTYDTLKYTQELTKNEEQKMWYQSSNLLEQVQKLRDIDIKTKSPFLNQTKELLSLIHQFTEIQNPLEKNYLYVDFDFENV